MRQEVLLGQARPEGLGAIAYHGLLQGLAVLLRDPAATTTPAPAVSTNDPHPVPAPELVVLLASMVLRAHQEVRHVF